jgi:type IV pilus assembly protein PilV
MRFSLNSRGFSLVEVMVALIVLSVGLLGIAKLQTVALSSTTVANKRSMAAIEAASLAAAMHVNRGYWTSGDPVNSTISVQGATKWTTTAGATALTTSLGNGPNCAVATPGAWCSVTDLAAYDLQQWANALQGQVPQGVLPNSTATISCGTPSTTTSCTININWSEIAVASNATETANQTAAMQIPSYTLYVEP